MYLPSSFEETRLEALHGMMNANPLATLITMRVADPGSGSAGLEIVADHIPVQTSAEPAPFGRLRGHIARANPLWRQHDVARGALCVFHGPHAYISPSLYPSKHPAGKVVPTWDYAVVHAHGHLSFIEDPAWLLELVGNLTDTHEAGRITPWKVADAPTDYIDRMLQAIVGFEFAITRLTGKWKVSQNRNAADRRGVITGLREAGDVNSQGVAELLVTQDAYATAADRS